MVFRHAVVLAASTAAAAALPDEAHPVVVVGGLLYQALEAKVTGGDCDTSGTFQPFWSVDKLAELSPSGDLPACLLEVMEPAGFDTKTQRTVPKKGIEVRPLGGFNNTGFGDVFFGMGDKQNDNVTIVAKLREQGYEDGHSLMGHSYDWRLGVGDWEDNSFPELKRMTENAVKTLGKKAVITAISLGGPYVHSFLRWVQRQDAAWTGRHVEAFVPVNGVFNGVSMCLSAVVSSVSATYLPPSRADCPECEPARPSPPQPSLLDRLLQWLIKKKLDQVDQDLQPVIGKWPVMYYLSPGLDHSVQPASDHEVVTTVVGKTPAECQAGLYRTQCGSSGTDAGWKFQDPNFLQPAECGACQAVASWDKCPKGYDEADTALIGKLCCQKHSCKTDEFKASEFPDLFEQLKHPQQAELMATALEWSTTADPGVPVHCIVSNNVQTWEHLTFHESAPKDLAVRLGSGDGVVELESLNVCRRWQSTVKVYDLPGVSHANGFSEEHAQHVIVSLGLGDNAWQKWTAPQYDEITESMRVPPESLVKRATNFAVLV